MLEIINSVDTLVKTYVEKLTIDFPSIITLFEKISFFGSFEFLFYGSLVIFFVFLTLYFLSGNVKIFTKFILPFLLSLILVTVLVYFSKIFFGRTGPIERVLYESDFSFPSGHTANSFVFFSSLYYLLAGKIKNQTWGKIFLLFTILIIFLVSISRLVLNVHFFSDVIGGLIFGCLGLVVTIFVYKFTNKQ